MKKLIFYGAIWTFFEKIGIQLIQFGISIVLARLLTPADYGLIGLLGIFMAISSTLVDSGLAISLIKKQNIDRVDESTVFFFNLFVSICLYFILFITSPIIAKFFQQPLLEIIIRVYGLSLIIDSFSNIQLNLLTKSLNFKRQFYINMPSTLFSGLVGICMAYNNYGVWSLVGYSVTSSLFKAAQLWLFNSWRPLWVFSMPKLKDHLSFGLPLLGSSLLNTSFEQLSNVIFGKFFSPAQLGFYTRAQTLQQLPVTNISTTISKVTLPAFAKIAHDDLLLKNAYRKVMVIIIFFLVPILTYMMLMSKEIILLLFGKQWLPSANYLTYLCASAMLYPLNAYNLNILSVKGMSKLIFKLEVIKKIIILINLFILVYQGIHAFLIGLIVVSVLAYLVNSFYSGLLINYSVLEQIKELFMIFLLSFISGIIVFSLLQITILQLNTLYKIFFSITTFTMTHVLLLFIINKKQTREVKTWILKK